MREGYYEYDALPVAAGVWEEAVPLVSDLSRSYVCWRGGAAAAHERRAAQGPLRPSAESRARRGARPCLPRACKPGLPSFRAADRPLAAG